MFMNCPEGKVINKFMHEKTSIMCRHCCYFRNGMAWMLGAYEQGLRLYEIAEKEGDQIKKESEEKTE